MITTIAHVVLIPLLILAASVVIIAVALRVFTDDDPRE